MGSIVFISSMRRNIHKSSWPRTCSCTLAWVSVFQNYITTPLHLKHEHNFHTENRCRRLCFSYRFDTIFALLLWHRQSFINMIVRKGQKVFSQPFLNLLLGLFPSTHRLNCILFNTCQFSITFCVYHTTNNILLEKLVV